MFNKNAFNAVYTEVDNPVKDFRNTVVFEMNAWEHTVEVLEKFILYFELTEDKMDYNDFCTVVVSIVKDRNKDKGNKRDCFVTSVISPP